MVDDAAALRKLFLQALRDAPDVSQADIAKACGVSDQAVNGWKSTGRIHKKHFPALARVLHKPLGYWHGQVSPDATGARDNRSDRRVDESVWGSTPASHSAGLDPAILRQSLDDLERIYASHGRAFVPREEVEAIAFAYDWLASPASATRSPADFGRAWAARERNRAEAEDGREDDRAGQHGGGEAERAPRGKAAATPRRS